MIKIIQGIFGHKVGNTIIPKSAKDEPFSCDEATEKRLVNSGVAIYIDESESIVEFEELETEAEAEETEAEVEVEKAEAEVAEANVEAQEMTRDDLIKAYKELGLKGNPAVMKDETLKAKIAQAAESVEDEEAPTFNAVDGVV
jgi:hypothetical protein